MFLSGWFAALACWLCAYLGVAMLPAQQQSAQVGGAECPQPFPALCPRCPDRSIMLFMAVTSTGSAELIAVSSLFSYDLYR